MITSRDAMHTGAECIREHETLEYPARRMRDLDVGRAAGLRARQPAARRHHRPGHRVQVSGGSSMRIGLIAPPWLPVPPPGYGGTELVIDNLARGLQELGHDVRLFTVGESTCPVPHEFLYPTGVAPMDADVPGSGACPRRVRRTGRCGHHPRPHRAGPAGGGPPRDPPATGCEHQSRTVHTADPPHLRRRRPARLDRGDLALAGPGLGRDPHRCGHPSRHRPGGVPARARGRRLPAVRGQDVRRQGSAPRGAGCQARRTSGW